MQKLEIIYKQLCELRPYENNPRLNEPAIPKVIASIEEFGFRVPLVISADGEIVAGHTRFFAAQQMGLDSVPCVLDGDMTETQRKAFRIADNKVAEFANWDEELLAQELAQIGDIDMSVFGALVETAASEFADIDDEGIGSTMGFDHMMRVDKLAIVLTEDEYARFRKVYDSYLDEHGVSFGFVKEWLDHAGY